MTNEEIKQIVSNYTEIYVYSDKTHNLLYEFRKIGDKYWKVEFYISGSFQDLEQDNTMTNISVFSTLKSIQNNVSMSYR